MARGNELIDFSRFHSRLRVKGALLAETAVRIGTGSGSDPAGADAPVIKDMRERPYIPGSSLKGALRAHLERLLGAMGDGLACCCTSRPTRREQLQGCLTQEDVDALKVAYSNDPAGLAQEIQWRSCWTCSVFGAPWLASKTLVRDLPVMPTTWFEQYLERDGVAIDRDTGRAAEGLLYSFEAVPPATAFRFEMVVENPSEQELGLVLLGLREFERGAIRLGGASSRGLGVVRLALDWEQSEWVTAANVRAYLGGKKAASLADPDMREQYGRSFLAAIPKEDGNAQKAGQ